MRGFCKQTRRASKQIKREYTCVFCSVILFDLTLFFLSTLKTRYGEESRNQKLLIGSSGGGDYTTLQRRYRGRAYKFL